MTCIEDADFRLKRAHSRIKQDYGTVTGLLNEATSPAGANPDVTPITFFNLRHTYYIRRPLIHVPI